VVQIVQTKVAKIIQVTVVQIVQTKVVNIIQVTVVQIVQTKVAKIIQVTVVQIVQTKVVKIIQVTVVQIVQTKVVKIAQVKGVQAKVMANQVININMCVETRDNLFYPLSISIFLRSKEYGASQSLATPTFKVLL
jgi:hypothetical protein